MYMVIYKSFKNMISRNAKKIFRKLKNNEKDEKQINDIKISKKVIKNYLPFKPVIIDCGAHIGTDTIELAKIPGSKIYAFEPVKEIFKQLVSNTKNCPNIHCFNVALNDFDGEADMYVSSGDSDGSSSLMKPKDHIVDHPDVLFNEVEKVKCKTLDSWAKENNVKRVDMLWLDMQGAEQKMLEASTVILDTVAIIHSEVSIRETYEGVQDYKVYKRFLEHKGFKVLVQAIPDGYDMGNVLFVKSN